MILHQGRTAYLGLALLCFALNAHADNMGFEVSAAGGVNWIHSDNTNLVITPFETDSVQVSSSATHGEVKAWRAGVGIYLYDQPKERPYFNQVLFEVNFYQNRATIKGDVFQYQLAEFNNYTFKAPVTSSRFMFDVKPDVYNYKIVETYAILGIGAAWNKVSYIETADPGIDPASALFLASNTKSNLAVDLGVGMKVELTNDLSARLEYIYAFLGHAIPAAGVIHPTAIPSFTVHTQSVLLGLSIKF